MRILHAGRNIAIHRLTEAARGVRISATGAWSSRENPGLDHDSVKLCSSKRPGEPQSSGRVHSVLTGTCIASAYIAEGGGNDYQGQ